jgi:hypothetical protein
MIHIYTYDDGGGGDKDNGNDDYSGNDDDGLQNTEQRTYRG